MAVISGCFITQPASLPQAVFDFLLGLGASQEQKPNASTPGTEDRQDRRQDGDREERGECDRRLVGHRLEEGCG